MRDSLTPRQCGSAEGLATSTVYKSFNGKTLIEVLTFHN